MKNVNQILMLNDVDFVTEVYQSLLHRAPDSEGLYYYLNRLHLGYGKISIIAQIANDPESKKIDANLPGLHELLKENKKNNHWLWGNFYRKTRVERQTMRLENQINHLEMQSQRIEKSIYDLSVAFNLLLENNRNTNTNTNTNLTESAKYDIQHVEPIHKVAMNVLDSTSAATTSDSAKPIFSFKLNESLSTSIRHKSPLEAFGRLTA